MVRYERNDPKPVGSLVAGRVIPIQVKEHEICDACHLSDAKYKASHEKHNPLYLCGHHYHKHRIYLFMHHYEIEEL
jgi:hypothetical protein